MLLSTSSLDVNMMLCIHTSWSTSYLSIWKKYTINWIKIKSVVASTMLWDKQLRDQQDMTLKLNEQWIIVQVEHDKRLNQLKIKQMIINILEEINKCYWEKMLNLKNKLKEVSHSVNQSWSHQSTESRVSTKSLSRQSIENHTQRKSFTLFNNDHHKFFKFLNSFIFTDEDEST